MLHQGPRATILNDLAYLCGGREHVRGPGQVLNSCWTASINGGGWTGIESMTAPRYFHSLTTVGSRLMVTGGVGTIDNYDDQSSVEFYSIVV